MIVNRFGVHVAAGVPFLLQQNGWSNLISPELKSPFELHKTFKRCPHHIDLESYVEAPEWISDPLANAFLPIRRRPNEKIKIILDPDGRLEALVSQLQRLSSPTGPLVLPIWGRRPVELRPHFMLTDITPIAFIGAELMHTKSVRHHANMAETFNRRVIIFARQRIPLFASDVDWITTDLNADDLAVAPLEAIGSGALRDDIS